MEFAGTNWIPSVTEAAERMTIKQLSSPRYCQTCGPLLGRQVNSICATCHERVLFVLANEISVTRKFIKFIVAHPDEDWSDWIRYWFRKPIKASVSIDAMNRKMGEGI